MKLLSDFPIRYTMYMRIRFTKKNVNRVWKEEQMFDRLCFICFGFDFNLWSVLRFVSQFRGNGRNREMSGVKFAEENSGRHFCNESARGESFLVSGDFFENRKNRSEIDDCNRDWDGCEPLIG